MSAQGNVIQQPIDGTGLAMVDPDNLAQLMYVHTTPFLTGDPNDPNFQNTATFRVRAMVPQVSEGSLAWRGNAIGWRMIVEDGVHRLELALSRSATFARQVWLHNTPSFVPMPFPWDNELVNTVEIRQLPDGDYEVLGSTVPIKLQLCDAGGANVSAAGVVVHASGLIKLDNTASGNLAEPGNANPDNDFRFDAALGSSGGYIYNLSTQGLSTGTWTLQFTASGDPVYHNVQFDLR